MHRLGRVLVTLGAVIASVTVWVGGAGTAATASSSGTQNGHLTGDGTWPGLGTVCEHGPGGAATARGVGAHSINIATFADPGNTASPGLNKEFFQLAGAFAKWCNAAGGIDGRTIVVHDRDGALFNAAQVTDEACQQDFMSVGGGLVFDQSAVPVRVGCGLGEIPSYVVSNEADNAALQVNPQGIRVDEIEAGWYRALGRRYPSAIKHFGIGAANEPSILEPTQKWEQAAQQQGWKVVDFQEPPFSVVDWAPFVSRAQSKGVEALETPTGTNVQTYFEAMQTAGYHPTFIFLGIGIPENLGKESYDVTVSGSLPPIYFATQKLAVRAGFREPRARAAHCAHAHRCTGRHHRHQRRVRRRRLAALRQGGLSVRRGSDRLVCARPCGVADELDRGRGLRADSAPGPFQPTSHAERLLPADAGQGQRILL